MSIASTQQPRDPQAVALGRRIQGILDQRGLSRRGFAKLVSPGNPEGVRRAVHRHLGGVHMPSRLTRRHYETVLGLPSGELDPDDEEGDRMSLAAVLRREIRVALREQMQT